MSMLAATILLAQLHCAPNAAGTVDCYDAQRGGAPTLEDRAEPLRRVRPTPERREARAVREEGERGDRVPGRAGGSEAMRRPHPAVPVTEMALAAAGSAASGLASVIARAAQGGTVLAHQARGMSLGTALILIAVGYVAFFHTRRFFKTVGVLVALLTLGCVALYVNEVYYERPKREAQQRLAAEQRAAQEQADRAADAHQSSLCNGEHPARSWTDHTGQSYVCPWVIKQQQDAKEQAARDQAANEQAAKEQAARDQAAKEQAAREQAAKARADAERKLREQALKNRYVQKIDDCAKQFAGSALLACINAETREALAADVTWHRFLLCTGKVCCTLDHPHLGLEPIPQRDQHWIFFGTHSTS